MRIDDEGEVDYEDMMTTMMMRKMTKIAMMMKTMMKKI